MNASTENNNLLQKLSPPLQIHWTLVLILGWAVGAWPEHHFSATLWQLALLLGGTAAAMLLAGLVHLVVCRMTGVAVQHTALGPAGLMILDVTKAPARGRALAAAAIPVTYGLIALALLPYFAANGGVEGLLASFDWWSGPMITSRLCFICLCLALVHLMPALPLSGAHLLIALGVPIPVVCRITQLTAALVGVWWAPSPVLIVIAISIGVYAERIRRHSLSVVPPKPESCEFSDLPTALAQN